jgi:hypothetical protein
LIESKNAKSAFIELQNLHEQWKDVGPVIEENKEALWGRFKEATKAINDKFQDYQSKQKEEREVNLVKKTEICEKVEATVEEEYTSPKEWDEGSKIVIEFQKDWRKIGMVSSKDNDSIYKRFKEACDNFFNRRRKHLEQVESSYGENLKKKIALCEELEQMQEGKIDLDRVTEIQDLWGKIGYVPRNSMKSIQKRFLDAVNSLADRAEIADDEKHVLKFKARFSKMNYGPNADKFLQKKENTLRRQITKLENDINLWRNNLDFFAKSRTADKLKVEFNKKIDSAEEELIELKNQLKVLNRI